MQAVKTRERKKYSGSNLFAYIVLTVIAGLLIIRCFYSFCWSDESFYLSLVHRFWIGDRPIIDEWSGTQFYTVILLPIYALYIKVVGSNEGIFLFFRLLMVISNYFLSIYIYISLKRYTTNILALIGSLVNLLYTRANILGASYYSIALLFFTLAVFLLFNFNRVGTSRIRMFSIGCALAIAILSLPYLSFVYILGIGVGMFFAPCRKYRKSLIVIMIGTGFCAVIYLGFIFSNMSLGEMVEYIPYLFGDVEHQSLNPFFSIVLWVGRIINRYKYTIVIPIASVIYVLFRNKMHKPLMQQNIKIIIIINFIICGINIIASYNIVGCVNIALAILAIICYLSIDYKDKVLGKIFYEIYLPGIVFSIVFHMASNTGLDAITVGFVLCGIASPILIFECVSKIRWYSINVTRWVWCGMVMIAAVALLQSGWLRFFSVYRDDKLENLTAIINRGPAKNLYTTEEHKKQYDDIIRTIEKTLGEEMRGTVVFTELVPWAYLCMNKPYGGPSPCRFWGGLSEERLKEYYTNMPDKFPKYVLAVTPEYGSCKSVLIQGNEVLERPNERGTSQWLIDKLEEMGYDKFETECGIVYSQN